MLPEEQGHNPLFCGRLSPLIQEKYNVPNLEQLRRGNPVLDIHQIWMFGRNNVPTVRITGELPNCGLFDRQDDNSALEKILCKSYRYAM